MVVRNLLAGLSALKDVEVVDDISKADYVGVLQHPERLTNELPENALVGPNLFVLPHEAPELCNRFHNFIVPSDWVKDCYSTFPQMMHKNIGVWPVGIDTKTWQPKTKEDLDCFIYFKNRSKEDLKWVRKICKYYKLNYRVIKYGSYQEKDLFNLAQRSRFAILLTGTESQGIAYMNILSTNTPCYVFDRNTWVYDIDKSYRFRASSVPYFDGRCGEVSPNINLERFNNFLEDCRVGKFAPREYILENHTLKKSAERYMQFLREAHA